MLILILIFLILFTQGASLVAQMLKESPCHAGDPGSVPELGRSPGEGNGEFLKNSMDPGGLQSVGSQRVGHDLVTDTFTFNVSSMMQLKHGDCIKGQLRPFIF